MQTPHDTPQATLSGDDLLAETMGIYGGRWQIQHDGETGCWTAIERPTVTSLNFLSSRDVPGLRGKLDDEAARSGL